MAIQLRLGPYLDHYLALRDPSLAQLACRLSQAPLCPCLLLAPETERVLILTSQAA